MTLRFSVSDFLAVVNQSLEASFDTIEIVGEVSSFKVNQQKFVFFDLKDDNGTVSCFMTIWQLRMPIEDGMKVVIRAQPKITNWGKFSVTVQEIQPLGEGNLKKSFEILKRKLSAEGLLDQDRKRSLPKFPSRVAIISSPQAAGYADFMKISRERWGGVRFIVTPVQVQGKVAADQMIRALEKLNQLPELPEVIVLIRGGGSADDLASFNDELLVRAVAASRVPVLTGIGHEIDESLCDLASDVQASTPSNAAQILFPDKREVLAQVRNDIALVAGMIADQIVRRSETVNHQVMDVLDIWQRRVVESLNKVKSQQQIIAEYDPEMVLRRGYAMISGERSIGSIVNITTSKEIMEAEVIKYDKR